MSLKDAAKTYFDMGLPVVPVKIWLEAGEWKKSPLCEWKQWQTRKQSLEEFESLPWSQCNGFAVICGSQLPNGLFFSVLDYDTKKLPDDVGKLGKLVLKFMPITQMEETPNKGQHWIYLSRKKPRNLSVFHDTCGLELIGENKLCIMAPSHGYRKLNDNTATVVEDIENLFLESLAKAGVKTRIEKPEAKAWFDREDLAGMPFKGVAPPCISRLLAGTETGSRNEFAIRLASFLVNFRKIDVKKAWKELKEWNEWNSPPLPESELKACLQSAVRNGYVYGCNDNILAKFCDRENCSLAKKQDETEKVYDPEVEAELTSELERILAAENQLEALKPHLDNVIVGEEESKRAIFVLLSGSKYPDVEYKQIILLKGTEGAGKSTLMRNLTVGYRVKDVGRFTAHALDYTNLQGFEVLSLKELGSLDLEKQGVSTLKFLSSDDKGYTVEATVRDEKTGKMTTETYRIPPITVISSTTRLVLDSQFERRAWLFGMDESPEQTKHIAEWKAKLEREKAEVLLGKRKITTYEFSREILKRFVAQIKPVKVVIPFPNTLSKLLGYNVLRIRGDLDKLFVFVKLYAAFNLKRLVKVKDDVYIVTPEVCMEALHIIGKPLTNMLASLDERVKGILQALKELKDVKEETYIEEDGERQQHEVEVRFDKRGSEITKKVREQIATRIGKSERTVRRFFDSLEAAGYASCDQKKPKTYTLLYDVEEIEEKLKGILDISKLSKDLYDKLEKEARNWLENTLDNQSFLDINSKLKITVNCEKPVENVSREERLSNPVFGIKQASFEERGLENWTTVECPTCRGEKQSKEEQKPAGLLECRFCRDVGKPIFFATEHDLKVHILRLHTGQPIEGGGYATV